jgi:Protein of unknown function (DUF3179)
MSQILADANGESSQQDKQADTPRRPLMKVIARGLTVFAIIVLAGFVVAKAQSLWREWSQLQAEIGGLSQSEVIGYRDIAPIVSYAEGPGDWFREEGNQSLLWAKWEDRTGHVWFRFPQGDIDRAHVQRPKTLFVSRAIDYPVIETGGGQIWQRVPPESPVVGYTLLGLKCVYPVLVLGKVQVINDVVKDHPFIIMVNLLASYKEAYSIFDAEQDGHRLTMAASGYFHDGKPLLYDRGTQSLWIEEEDSLTAIAGKHKRMKLARVARPTPVTWKTWLSQNETSRLLVGADRTRGIPSE